MNNGKELLKLVQENPDLPIVPMVDGEVCCDDGMYWQGSFGRAKVNEWVCVDEHFYTRDDQDEIEILFSNTLCDNYPDMPDDEFFKMIHKMIDDLPWKKAIIVYIELPEA